MKTRCIHVDLSLCQNIHMSFATGFTTCQIVKGKVLVVSKFIIKDSTLPINTTLFHQFLDLHVITTLPTDILQYVEVELVLHNDVIGKAHYWSLYLLASNILSQSLLWQIMNIHNAVVRNCDIIHRQPFELADTTTKGTLQDKSVLRFL